MSSVDEGAAVFRASPSLALLKYWGKRPRGVNLPATPSLAVTLGGIETVTEARLGEGGDRVTVDGEDQDGSRYAPLFHAIRREAGADACFTVESRNGFPASAGLASSSSGLAALTCACAAAAGARLSARRLSSLSRIGSASAARSIFGGFVLLRAGARWAEQLYPPEHWSRLRIVAAVVSELRKPLSSRRAMERVRSTSPAYRSWVRTSRALLPDALRALGDRDLEKLGEIGRISAMRMHATMLAADPPFCYWLPATVAVIEECRRMRRDGVGAWETMDAGPQVKILCDVDDVDAVTRRVGQAAFGTDLLVCAPGQGARRMAGVERPWG